MFELSMENGKYITTIDNHGRIIVYRHGEYWRDLTGDNYILSLLHLIEDQQNKIEQLQEMNSDLSWGVASAEGRAL